MDTEQLRARLTVNPFRPFTVRMADGMEHRVWHRDFALLSPFGDTLHLYHRDRSIRILDVPLMSEIHLDAETEPAASNH